MDIEQATEIFWKARQAGELAPEPLRGRLSLPEGAAIQRAVLERLCAQGEVHAGWKIAGTSPASRQAMGLEEPAAGYLLESGGVDSGQMVELSQAPRHLLECELCVVIGQRLQGPGIDRAAALAATARVEASFELVAVQTDFSDFPLVVAGNVVQWRYVTGDALQPWPPTLAWADLCVQLDRDGRRVHEARAGDVLEDPFGSVAWLANHLAASGRALEAGQRVLTGSFGPPAPVERGEHWTAAFSGVGSVSVAFR